MRLLAFLIRASGWSLLPSSVSGILSGVGIVAVIALIRTGLADFGRDSTALAWRYVFICGAVLVSGVISQLLLVRFSQRAILDLRLDLGRQILAAPLSDIETIGPARLTALLADDVNVLANCLMVLPGLFINLAIIVTCFAYMWWLSGATFFYVVTFMVFGIVSYQLPSVYAWKQFGKARLQQDILFVHFRGLTEGVKDLKLHTSKRDAFLKRSLEATAAKYRERSVAGLNIYSIASSWGQLLFFLLIAFLLFLLPRLRNMNYEVVSGYVLVALYLMAPLGTLLAMLPVFGRASVAFANVEKLGLSLRPERTKAVVTRETNGVWREIKLENVSHTYYREGEEAPFRIGPVNLSFVPGEIVFLIGGNGSGKTTFAKVLTSLYPPESGRISVNGEPVTNDNRETYRNHFAAVFSDSYLFDNLNGIGLDVDEETVNRYLKEFSIGNKVHVRNGALSTIALSQGQRKRLALLISCLEDREFYIFDEWAADQDPVFKKVFYTEVLPELKSRGKTALVITHDERYFEVADRLIKMEFGQIRSDLYRSTGPGPVVPSVPGSNGTHSSTMTA